MCLILNSYQDREVLISRLNFVRFLFVGLDEGRSLHKKVGYARLARVLDASARKKRRVDQLKRKTHDLRTRVAK
jgi:hypothetical protein